MGCYAGNSGTTGDIKLPHRGIVFLASSLLTGMRYRLESLRAPTIRMSGFEVKKDPFVVLCLDDERGALAVRSLLLQSAGYVVLSANNAEEALRLFRNSHIDLVLSDHVLKGTSGSEVALKMKSIRPQVPIVLYSGKLDQDVPAHVDAFISKDVSPTDLLIEIARLLHL
jgi:CheY-like chemotaxis protein